MTPTDLILGIVIANTILYLGKEIREVLIREIEDSLSNDYDDIFGGGRHFSSLLSKLRTRRKYNKFIKTLPDNHTYKKCIIKKLSDNRYELTTGTWNNTEKLNSHNLYYHFNNPNSDAYDEVNEMLNDYNKTKQFKKEMAEVIND